VALGAAHGMRIMGAPTSRQPMFLHPTAKWGSVVNQAKSLRTTAKVLHETLRGMEESPDVNPSELPFLKLKSTVLEQEVNLQEQAKAIETPPIEETTD
jgi:hypothetical protein